MTTVHRRFLNFTGGGLESVYVVRPDVAATDTVVGSCRRRQQLPTATATPGVNLIKLFFKFEFDTGPAEK